MEIYLLKGDQPQGPYSVENLQTMFSAGEISPADRAWHEGLPEWMPISDVIPDVVPVPPAGDARPSSSPKESAEAERCGSCGTPNTSGGNFCSQCGNRLLASSKPPPLPPTVKSAPAKGSKRFSAWKESVKNVNRTHVLALLLLLLFIFGAISAAISPKKLPPQKNPPTPMTEQEVITLSHFDRRDTDLFQRQADQWAFQDVRVGWQSGRISGVPSKGELEDFAIGRWNVFKTTDECKQLQRPDMDMYSARDCWIDEYKSEFVSRLRPLIQEARRNNAPAF